ncbi:MAG: manganese efflux pump [Clostridia bacterium]|nr:manganese efflux pump [Clostridia bacterium]
MTKLLQIFGIGVGLSADAFAVAVCRGLGMRKLNHKHALIIALFFGGFQALMPYIGWLLTTLAKDRLDSFGGIISFVLLAFIGGKMIFEAVTEKDDGCEECKGQKLDLVSLTMMAVATSIDALVTGVAFYLDKTNIYIAISIIGVTTFVLSYLGVIVGNKFGSIYKRKAEIAGGVVLVIIGIKFLLEHFNVFESLKNLF